MQYAAVRWCRDDLDVRQTRHKSTNLTKGRGINSLLALMLVLLEVGCREYAAAIIIPPRSVSPSYERRQVARCPVYSFRSVRIDLDRKCFHSIVLVERQYTSLLRGRAKN